MIASINVWNIYLCICAKIIMLCNFAQTFLLFNSQVKMGSHSKGEFVCASLFVPINFMQNQIVAILRNQQNKLYS